MSKTSSEWAKCPWDPGEVRLLARGLGKVLIQARALTEPGFLADDQVTAWFPEDTAELHGHGRSARTLLGHAATNARLLQAVGFLPHSWHTSATLVPGPPAAGELASVVHQLLSGDVDEENPVAALGRAANLPDPPPNWAGLIVWGELPELLRLVGQFPDPKPRPPAVVPRWDPDAGVLWYGRRRARGRVDPGAENIRTLLDAFAAAGWAAKIPSPFRGGATVMHYTLDRLRENLRHITFRSESGGTMACWERTAKKPRTSERKPKGKPKGGPAGR